MHVIDCQLDPAAGLGMDVLQEEDCDGGAVGGVRVARAVADVG